MGMASKLGGFILALGTTALFSAGTAEAAHKHRQRPAPPYGLEFHAPFDFYPRYGVRGRYFPDAISVYEPVSLYHPRFGNRIWFRY